MTAHYQLTCISIESHPQDAFATLDEAAELCGLHPEMIEEFLRGHLVSGFQDNAGTTYFDQTGIVRLRQISQLRHQEHTNLRTLRYIIKLLDRLEAREEELRELRERLR